LIIHDCPTSQAHADNWFWMTNKHTYPIWCCQLGHSIDAMLLEIELLEHGSQEVLKECDLQHQWDQVDLRNGQ
jgi:hypothetical protein